MAYVNVPKDLNKIKSKVLFNLTKRQLICFGVAALMGVPLFFLLKDSAGTTAAAMVMILVMLPGFLFGVYEKNGQPLEVVLRQMIESCFIRPKERPYQTDNAYAALVRQYHKTLNVGRVLSPTLNLLVERDGKIATFKKEKYHIVQIGCGSVKAESERIADAAEANALQTACEHSQAVCASLKKEKKTIQPPKLYDLTSLQREANRIYGFTAKQTLDYAQALYEKRLLTYPRTDSNYITSNMEQTADDLVAELLPQLPFMQGVELAPEMGLVINNAKVSWVPLTAANPIWPRLSALLPATTTRWNTTIARLSWKLWWRSRRRIIPSTRND